MAQGQTTNNSFSSKYVSDVNQHTGLHIELQLINIEILTN